MKSAFLVGGQLLLAGFLIYYWYIHQDDYVEKPKEHLPILKLNDVQYKQFNEKGEIEIKVLAHQALYYEEKTAQLEKVILNTPTQSIEAEKALYEQEKVYLREKVKINHEKTLLETEKVDYDIESQVAVLPEKVFIKNPLGYIQANSAIIQKNHVQLSGKVESYYDGSN